MKHHSRKSTTSKCEPVHATRTTGIPTQTAPSSEGSLRILGEIIACLEKSRDSHALDLMTSIERLKLLYDLTAKALELNDVELVAMRKYIG